MDKNVRIGYFIPEFPAQTHAFFWRELRALKRLGIAVDIISTKKPPEKLVSHPWAWEAMEWTTYFFPPPFLMTLKALLFFLFRGFTKWRQVIAAIFRADAKGINERVRYIALAFFGTILAQRSREEGWRHVHVHSCADSANIALFAHLLSGVTYSLTLHSELSFFGSNQKEKWAHAAFCIAVSDSLIREVEHQPWGNLPRIIKKAPMGVDTDMFHRKTPYVAWRAGESCRVFSCGRLNPGKRHKDIIEAVYLLKTRGIEVDLRIAGEDDSAEGRVRSALEQQMKQLRLEENVKLIGAVSELRVCCELEKAHVFVLASQGEAIGVAIMEAMAMAIPVVATKVGGVPELVEHGITGFLVPPGKPLEISSAIETVISSPDIAERIGSASRKKIVKSFHERKSAETIMQCLKETGIIP